MTEEPMSSRIVRGGELGKDAPRCLPKNVTPAPSPVTLLGSSGTGALGCSGRSLRTQLARLVLPATAVKLSRPRVRSRGRGFTLVELLITVAMVGVMSALAMVGYRRYLYSAQSSEAKNVIEMIRGAQEAYKSEMLQYLSVSTNINTFYPNTAPNDVRYAWVYPSHADYNTGWKLLSVNPDGPVRFGYACVAGITPASSMQTLSAFITPPTIPTLNPGTAWYEIQAKNDHDKNGIFAVFASTSLSGEIMGENETE